jgi:hypothetical protein
MEILEFNFFNKMDDVNLKYSWWSRIYEYDWVIKSIEKLTNDINVKIHNTSWGFEGDHVLFKNTLDNNFKNSLHSDIKISNLL